MFGPFGSLREISRPAGTGQLSQATPALVAPPLTRSGSRTAVGWSRSSRLPPSCVSPSHLAGPKHAGKLEDPEGERRLPSDLCVCARAHTHSHARTHAQGAVVAVEPGFPFRGVFQGLRGLTFSGGQSFPRPAVVWGKWARFPCAFFLQRRSQALKSCDATLALGSHRQPFDSQDGDKLEGIGLRDWKNTSLLCLL